LDSLFILWVVVDACRIYIFILLIEKSLRQADLADAYLQLREIVHRIACFEALIIQGKTFDDVFLKPLCGSDNVFKV
jgi:hypothetical protein